MEQTPARTRRSFTNEFRRDAVAMVLDDGNVREKFGESFSVKRQW